VVDLVVLSLIPIGLFLAYAVKRRQHRQLAFIDSYQFHPALERRVLAKYPHLSARQLEMVFDGLRDYFHLCHRARRRMVAMPSQVVDVAWHEFILFTKAYSRFSKAAIGRYLHHTPTEAMRTPTLAQEGIKRAWRLACAKEAINPAKPHRLPLIFAIDGLLNIEDGFNYSLDCQDRSSPNYGSGYCAGHIGCASGCGGDSGGASDGGFFDGGGSDGGSSDGASCGGGGCGGD